MKKKKSKKQAFDFAKELDELDAEQNEEDAAATSALPADDGAVTNEDGEKVDAWVADDRAATYPEVRSISLDVLLPLITINTHLHPSPKVSEYGTDIPTSCYADSSRCCINITPSSLVKNVDS